MTEVRKDLFLKRHKLSVQTAPARQMTSLEIKSVLLSNVLQWNIIMQWRE